MTTHSSCGPRDNESFARSCSCCWPDLVEPHAADLRSNKVAAPTVKPLGIAVAGGDIAPSTSRSTTKYDLMLGDAAAAP